MELFFALLSALIRILILSVTLFKCSVLASQYTHYDIAIDYSTGFICACIAITAYNLLLYPLFLDPLRVFPVVDINDARIMFPVTDVPRGEAALEWMKQYPGYDALRLRIRYTVTVLVPLSPRALRDVLSTYQDDYEKPMSGHNYLSRILGYGLIVSEGDRHARQRKQLTPHFRIQNIRALHDLMLTKTDLLLRKMEEECNQIGKVEIGNWASKATLDIIGATLMSKDFNSLEVHLQPENEAFAQLTEASPGQTFLFAMGLILPKFMVSALPTKTNAMIRRTTQSLRRTCDMVLTNLYDKKARNDADVKSDILSSLVQDPSVTREDIIDQMITFLGAGHETTATSVAWVTHLLTLPENLQYQTFLRNEIMANPGCTKSPSDLERLPWLNAICEETLRLFPPVTTTARKAIRDTSIANVRVPKNTVLSLFPWATNRNPHLLGGRDSECFVPQRWIDTLPDGRLRANKHGGAESNYCELTFLHGNRSCIGRDFAKAELRCIVARMFSGYHVERLPGDDGHVVPAGSITIKPLNGLFVKLTRVPSTSGFDMQ